MFETMEHTADLGLRVKAPDLACLFREAARGFLGVLLQHPEAVEAREEREIELDAVESRVDDLFFDWLNELLYLFETERLLFCRFDLEVGEGGLRAKLRGERFDPSRHGVGNEIKAITYHGLKVVRRGDDGGWLAEVILDI